MKKRHAVGRRVVPRCRARERLQHKCAVDNFKRGNHRHERNDESHRGLIQRKQRQIRSRIGGGFVMQILYKNYIKSIDKLYKR